MSRPRRRIPVGKSQQEGQLHSFSPQDATSVPLPATYSKMFPSPASLITAASLPFPPRLWREPTVDQLSDRLDRFCKKRGFMFRPIDMCMTRSSVIAISPLVHLLTNMRHESEGSWQYGCFAVACCLRPQIAKDGAVLVALRKTRGRVSDNGFGVGCPETELQVFDAVAYVLGRARGYERAKIIAARNSHIECFGATVWAMSRATVDLIEGTVIAADDANIHQRGLNTTVIRRGCKGWRNPNSLPNPNSPVFYSGNWSSYPA